MSFPSYTWQITGGETPADIGPYASAATLVFSPDVVDQIKKAMDFLNANTWANSVDMFVPVSFSLSSDFDADDDMLTPSGTRLVVDREGMLLRYYLWDDGDETQETEYLLTSDAEGLLEQM